MRNSSFSLLLIRKVRVATASLMISLAFSCSAWSDTKSSERTGGVPISHRDGAVLATLVVTNRLSIDRTKEPLSSGVPLVEAADIRHVNELAVHDGAKEIPAQFRVLARWGGAPGDDKRAVKWVLVHFQANVASGATARYQLVRIRGRNSVNSQVIASRISDGAIRVDTGVAKFVLGPDSLLRLERSNGESATPLTTSAATLNSFLGDTAGSTAQNRRAARFEITENGSLESVVTVVEELRFRDDCKLSFRHRFHFYRDKSFVRAFHTVTNHNASDFRGIDDPTNGNCLIEKMGLDAKWNLRRERADVLIGGEKLHAATIASTGTVRLYQDSSGKENWKVPGGPYSFRGYRIYENAQVTASGNQAAGWMDVSDETAGMTVAVRHFWQNNPKTLLADGKGILRIGLWPEDFSKPHWIFGGFQKTHEVFYYFHLRNGVQAGAADMALAFQDPLFAQTSSHHYVSSGGFGPTAAEHGQAFPDYERLVTAQIDGAAGDSQRNLVASNIDKWNVYGIEFFGDTDQESDVWTWKTRQLSNLEQDGTWAMLLAFARKGDLRFLDLAIPMARHSYDIDIDHSATGKDLDKKYAGANRKHGTYNIGNGAELTHVWLQGLLTYYYLTGDALAFEGARSIADNVVYRIESGRDAAKNEERIPGWSIKALLQFYEATHDRRYLEVALAMKQKVLMLQHPTRGYFDGEKTNVNPWMCGVLVEALYELWDITGRKDDTLRKSIIGFARWLRDSAWNKSYKTFPQGWMPKDKPYSFGANDRTVNTLMVVDAMVIGYWLTGESSYWGIAQEAFETGTRYPWGSRHVGYSDAKVAAKQMRGGHRYLYEVSRIKGDNTMKESGGSGFANAISETVR